MHRRAAASGPRDLVGYAGSPPNPRWPEGARLAVNVVLNYEEGAECTPVDGDERRELRGESQYDIPPDERDLLQETVYEYGSRAGIWRILRMLDDHAVPATVFASGRALERNPAVAAAIVERGYDVVGHGYRWEPHVGMSEEAERTAITRAVASIEQTTGYRIEGWFTRPLPSVRTRRLLMEAGLKYDSDSYGDDLPYYVKVAGRPHLVVPYTVDVNDYRFWNGTMLHGDDWYRYARDCFDVLYEEGASAPKMMSVGLHARIAGRPPRAAGLQRFLEHITGVPAVWLCRRNALADHWLRQHPPEG